MNTPSKRVRLRLLQGGKAGNKHAHQIRNNGNLVNPEFGRKMAQLLSINTNVLLFALPPNCA